jgi:tRNA-dihydrouridine synthase B
METDQEMGGWAVGGLKPDGRALLAPLSGVTDVGFRRIARRFGASLVVSEMVACDEYVRGEAEARLRAEGDGVAPHVVQLAGREPVWVAEAARLAEANGAAIVDLNMGCPAKRVTGGYAGSALMRDLALAGRLIEAAVKAVAVPVTVKMRLGWDHACLNAADLARLAESLGARAVTVHGRTRQQFYKGSADWDRIADVVRAVRIPVVANGDIGSAADARRALAASGAAAVMVGRAAMGRPWRVGQVAAALDGRPVREPTPAERADAALEHYDALLVLFGRPIGVRHARKHLAAYADVALADEFDVSPEDRRTLVTADDPAPVRAALARLWDRPGVLRAAA